MKLLTSASIGAVLGVLLLAGGQALSQEDPQPPPNPQDFLKWMQPGPGHDHLKATIGKWDSEWKVWMMGPGSQPAVSKGTAETKWKLPGLFTETEERVLIMGMPYRSFGVEGYNKFRKQYEVSKIGTMGTHQDRFIGTLDDSGKVMTYTGTIDEPTLNQRDKKVKAVITFESADKYVMEIHDLEIEGENTKVVEITYTRKASADDTK